MQQIQDKEMEWLTKIFIDPKDAYTYFATLNMMGFDGKNVLKAIHELNKQRGHSYGQTPFGMALIPEFASIGWMCWYTYVVSQIPALRDMMKCIQSGDMTWETLVQDLLATQNHGNEQDRATAIMERRKA